MYSIVLFLLLLYISYTYMSKMLFVMCLYILRFLFLQNKEIIIEKKDMIKLFS